MADTSPSNKQYVLIKNEADRLFENGKLIDALEKYEKAIELHPQYWGAYYQKGNVLTQLKRYLEGSTAFMSAWLYSRFRDEPGLMCGRTLVLAGFSLEATLVFERIAEKNIDPLSALFYADALRCESRSREAVSLIKLFQNLDNPLRYRVLGGIYTELGNIEDAYNYLQLARNSDTNGYVYETLIGIYYAKNDLNSLRSTLEEAIKKNFTNEYYLAQKAALDVIEGKRDLDGVDLSKYPRSEIIESAIYIKPKLSLGCALTGTTYQTLDLAANASSVKGLVLEFGVRNGHSINRIAELFPNQKVYGFDSFEGIPESWNDESAGSYTALGRLPKVPDNVEFVVGWFEETLPGFKKSHTEPISYMNIDCDIYSATKTIFDELDNQIVPGTVIVFDEYLLNKSWKEDEFKAFQEWVSSRKVKYKYLAASMYTKQAAVQITSREKL